MTEWEAAMAIASVVVGFVAVMAVSEWNAHKVRKKYRRDLDRAIAEIEEEIRRMDSR